MNQKAKIIKKTILPIFLTTLIVLIFTSCIRKKNQNNDPTETGKSLEQPISNQIDASNKSAAPEKVPQSMKLCIRPAHYLALRACVRKGKWIRMTVAANDVDNDRSDVFTSPRLSLKKENFYLDTFKFEDGINHQTQYPDFYHTWANYGGSAHFVFAVPNSPSNTLTYSFSGRDEIKENLSKTLGTMNRQHIDYVKTQHWNDGGTFKKFAQIFFDIIGDYSETNYRYECAWGEELTAFVVNQSKTKDGLAVPYIPETYLWRKESKSCEDIPSVFENAKFVYLPFKEHTANPITKDHKISLLNRNKIKITNTQNTDFIWSADRFNMVHPMSQPNMKLDGTTPLFKNEKQEPVSRWEAIYDDDLTDQSFVPEM